jgi:hypothetical protein
VRLTDEVPPGLNEVQEGAVAQTDLPSDIGGSLFGRESKIVK